MPSREKNRRGREENFSYRCPTQNLPLRIHTFLGNHKHGVPGVNYTNLKYLTSYTYLPVAIVRLCPYQTLLHTRFC